MSQTHPHNLLFRPLRSPHADLSPAKPLTPTLPPTQHLQTLHPECEKEEKGAGPTLSHEQASMGCTCGKGRGEMQLLVSRCDYLRRDNQLLENQIIYLNEHIHQLTLSVGRLEGQAKRQLEVVAQTAWTHLQQMNLTVVAALQQLQNKQQQIDSRLTGLVFAVKKIKLKAPKGRPTAGQLSPEMQVEQVKLIEKVRALEEELSNRNSELLKKFEWKPQHIPSFAFRDRTNLQQIATPLKLGVYPGPCLRTQHKREHSQYLEHQQMPACRSN